MRTYQNYVEESVARGRSMSQILGVALVTRWKGNLPEIMEYYKELRRRERN